MRIIFLAIALLVPSLSTAEITLERQHIAIYIPQNQWKVRVPAGDWVLAHKTRRSDGLGVYYMFTSESLAMNLSIDIDHTDKCNSAKSCQELFWSNPGPLFKNPKDVKRFETNGFQAIQFYLDGVGGLPVKQSNISAHMYTQGFWIDIRISKVGKVVPQFAPMVALINSISIQ